MLEFLVVFIKVKVVKVSLATYPTSNAKSLACFCYTIDNNVTAEGV